MIHEIEHDGAMLPLKLSYGAFHLTSEDKSVADSGSATGWTIALFFYSLQAGHFARKIPFKLTKEDAVFIWEDHVDEFKSVMETSEVLKKIKIEAERFEKTEKKTQKKT